MDFALKGIDHVQLAAPKGSEEAARSFFAGILGMTEIDKPEKLRKRGGVWFQFGSSQLHIGIEEPFIPARKAHPAFATENLKSLRKHLRENNTAFLEDSSLPGADRIYINDPFGNRIEILEWI
ncbi:VOC family protein [Mesobacillus foraminis]|uniref:VOC family protein n=1 Tax=Mesobacillus foraminis TaxID=279826 RepID=UPI001BEC0F94|nr:VOC family protein [Mesobacillus foraminis]MBT2758672.1 VOC family protein [Mesobacillus foraminis]